MLFLEAVIDLMLGVLHVETGNEQVGDPTVIGQPPWNQAEALTWRPEDEDSSIWGRPAIGGI